MQIHLLYHTCTFLLLTFFLIGIDSQTRRTRTALQIPTQARHKKPVIIDVVVPGKLAKLLLPHPEHPLSSSKAASKLTW